MKQYKALRPAHINNTPLNIGDTITLHQRAAQFLIADGTLKEVATTKPAATPAKGAK